MKASLTLIAIAKEDTNELTVTALLKSRSKKRPVMTLAEDSPLGLFSSVNDSLKAFVNHISEFLGLDAQEYNLDNELSSLVPEEELGITIDFMLVEYDFEKDLSERDLQNIENLFKKFDEKLRKELNDEEVLNEEREISIDFKSITNQLVNKKKRKV